MSWKSQDLRPSLAKRVFDDLAAQTGKTVAVPTGKANDGRPFQDRIVRTAKAYQALGVLKLEKVDPPVRILPGNRIIFMENPWSDFSGILSQDGRMLAIEAKSTQEHLLPFNRDGGLTVKQVELLIAWGKAGAISGVLWEMAGTQCCWFSWWTILEAKRDGLKSLRFEDIYARNPVVPGAGLIEWEFAPVLSAK